MLRFTKILAITLGAFCLFTIISAILLSSLVNPNQYKAKLSQYVYNKIGRDLQIDGDISWSFFPHLGLKITEAKLANPSDFPHQAFAKIKEANIKIAVLPLFTKQIQAEQLFLKNLELNLIKNKAGANNWQFTLSSTPPKLSTQISTAQISAAPLLMNIAKIQVSDANINYWDQQSDTQYSIKHLAFSSQDVSFNKFFPAKLKLQILSKEPDLSGELDLQGSLYLDLAQDSYQFKTAQLQLNLSGSALPNSKLNLTADTDILLTQQMLSIKPLKLILDKQTQISGEITHHLNPQFSSFKLYIPELNLSSSNNKARSSSASTALLPLALLKKLEAKGHLTIDKLVYNELLINQLSLSLNAKNGIVNLAPIQAKLYQGAYQGEIKIDTQKTTPTLSTQQALKNIQLAPLLSALNPQAQFPLSGTANLSLQLNTLGNDITGWTKHLNGSAHFEVNKGIIKNIDLEYQLARIRNFINKQAQPQQSQPQQTNFDSLVGNFHINQGIAHNPDLLLQAQTGIVKGQGELNLNNKTLAYKIQATATSENLGRDVYKIQDYLGGQLPILINGPWDNPKIEPDWNQISQALTKALIKQQTHRLKDKLSQKIDVDLDSEANQQLKNTLESLFK